MVFQNTGLWYYTIQGYGIAKYRVMVLHNTGLWYCTIKVYGISKYRVMVLHNTGLSLEKLRDGQLGGFRLINDQSKTLANSDIFPVPDDRDQMLSDRIPTTSCTAQLSCRVEPQTTASPTDPSRALSVRCARNVPLHTHSRENAQSEPNCSPISYRPDARELQTGCDPVGGSGGVLWAGVET